MPSPYTPEDEFDNRYDPAYPDPGMLPPRPPTTTTTGGTGGTGGNTDDWRRDPTINPINRGHQPRSGYVWHWNHSTGEWYEVQDQPTYNEPNTGGGYDFNTPTAWDWPTFTAPRFEGVGDFAAPPAFSYAPFAAPSLADAQNEPGYAFARDEGQRALETAAAARGIARTGGTLKDLIGWGNRFAEQNYGNVFNRSAQTYGMNRENALGNYLTNYNVSRDVFDRNYGQARDIYDRDYQAALAEFNPRFEGSRLSFEDAYRRWRDALDANTRIATAGAV